MSPRTLSRPPELGPRHRRERGARPGRWPRLLERLAIGVTSLAIAVVIIILLSGGPLGGRDNPQLQTATGPPLGVRYPDQGDAHLAAGALHPAYDSNPPTSGAHVPLPVLHEDSPLSDDQLLQALAAGDVVIAYGTLAPGRPLQRLTRSLAPPFSPGLAAAGRAVILDRRPGTAGLIALAWTRMLRVGSPSDPRLREFAAQWLGRGAAASSAAPR